jgi:hypothetical protein
LRERTGALARRCATYGRLERRAVVPIWWCILARPV